MRLRILQAYSKGAFAKHPSLIDHWVKEKIPGNDRGFFIVESIKLSLRRSLPKPKVVLKKKAL
jgi:hypothetical protein